MADMLSKNLSGEVEKGKRENAYNGKHVGGIPPLGYDVDLLPLAEEVRRDGNSRSTTAEGVRKLEKENVQLKKLVADLSLDIALLKDLNSKNW